MICQTLGPGDSSMQLWWVSGWYWEFIDHSPVPPTIMHTHIHGQTDLSNGLFFSLLFPQSCLPMLEEELQLALSLLEGSWLASLCQVDHYL